MQNIIRVILFVLVNVAGWYGIQIIAVLAMKYGIFPQLPAEYNEMLKFWYFGIGMWVLIGSAIVSIGYFFARDEIKNWLLFAPMYITGSYCVATIIYFKYFFSIA